jgi:hypothetical protein
MHVEKRARVASNTDAQLAGCPAYDIERGSQLLLCLLAERRSRIPRGAYQCSGSIRALFGYTVENGSTLPT